MTKSTITRERLEEIVSDPMINQGSEFAMMARMALAAMESEADCKERKLFCSTDTARMRKVISASAGTEDAPLYRHAQPASERDQVRSAHAEWSQATFGNVGPVGPLKHLSKEALEAAEQPGDLSEWADMQFLLWDAQRRAGITDDQITQAMIDKLAVNKQREWPEPKDGEPRLHIKEQPAPVVPEEWTIADAVKFCKETGRQDAGAAMDAWNACRAAMLQELKKSAGTEATCRSNENVQAVEVQSLTSINPAPDLVSLRKKAESIIGNYPGIPDGYVMVPKEPTKQMILAGQEELESCIDNGFDSDIDGNRYDYTDIVPDAPHRVFMAMLAAAPQEGK